MATDEFCPPVIPGTYNGRVTIYGQPAFDGGRIVALIDEVEWGSAVTQDGRYVVTIPAPMPVRPPCFPGGRIVFRCADLTAAESPEWGSGLHDLDLTFAAPRVGAVQATREPSEAMQAPELEPPDDILLFLDSEGDQLVDSAEIGAAVNIDVPLVEGYLDELELEGLVTVARTFGGYSAFITPRGRVSASRVRRGRVPGGGKRAPEAADARKTGATLPGGSPSTGRSVFLAHSFDNAGKLVAGVLCDFLGLLGFRVETGEAYSPRGVSSKIKERIREQAIAVCILTKKRGAGADPRRTSQWVLDEATVAEALEKPVFLLIEKGVEAEIGIHGDREHIPFTMRSLQGVMIKLLQGLRELGYDFAPQGGE